MSSEETTIINKIITGATLHGKNWADYGIDTSIPFKIYAPVGCLECNNTGYKGQIGIFEAIYNNEKIEEIITKNPSEREIRAVARDQVSLTMAEDGLVKILKGITDYDEVAGVVDMSED
jgi:type II secretory ATPase GspE/PulE/Tfp pilus assembly ATPase PilB-like protein